MEKKSSEKLYAEELKGIRNDKRRIAAAGGRIGIVTGRKRHGIKKEEPHLNAL